MKTTKLTAGLMSLAVLAGVALAVPGDVKAAEQGRNTTGDITLGAADIRFNPPKSFTFASKMISIANEESEANTVKATYAIDGDTIGVLDLRGGHEGWYVTVNAKPMYNDGDSNKDELPMSSFKMTVGDEPAAFHAAGEDLATGTSEVEVFAGNATPTVLTGTEDTNGLHVSGDIDAKIAFGPTLNIKNGAYSGVINWTLTDSLPPTP